MNRILVLIVATCVLYSCQKEDIEISYNVLLPLNTMNEWKYIDTTFHYYSGVTEADTSIISFVNYYKIDNVEGYTYKTYEKGKPISLLNNDKSGNLEEFFLASDTLVFNTIRYKLDVKKGDVWKFKTAVYSDNDYSNAEVREFEMICITSDTIISTPCGDFSCIGYQYSPTSGSDIFIQYYSINVGWIQSLHFEEGNLFRKKVLADYTLIK